MAQSFEQLDKVIGDYYKSMGIDNYFNADGRGKFLVYCQEHELEIDELNNELEGDYAECIYLEFDEDNFPFDNQENKEYDQDQKHSAIFEIIKYCHKNNKPPMSEGGHNDNDDNNDDNYGDEEKKMDGQNNNNGYNYKMRANQSNFKLWNLTLYSDKLNVGNGKLDATNIDNGLIDLRYVFAYILHKYYSGDCTSSVDNEKMKLAIEAVHSSVDMFSQYGGMSICSDDSIISSYDSLDEHGEKENRDKMRNQQLGLLREKFEKSKKYRDLLDGLDDMYYEPNSKKHISKRGTFQPGALVPPSLKPENVKKQLFQSNLNVNMATIPEIKLFVKVDLKERKEKDKITLQYSYMRFDCFNVINKFPAFGDSLFNEAKKYDSKLFELIDKWYCVSYREFDKTADGMRNKTSEELFAFGLLSNSIQVISNAFEGNSKRKVIRLSLFVWNSMYSYKSDGSKDLGRRPDLSTLLSNIKKTNY